MPMVKHANGFPCGSYHFCFNILLCDGPICKENDGSLTKRSYLSVKDGVTDQRANEPSDRRTNRPTDRVSDRGAKRCVGASKNED